MRSGKYRAYINVGKKQFHLGLFVDWKDAHKAYLTKLEELKK